MRLSIKILIGLLLITSPVFCQSWTTINLTDYATINFPAQPEKQIIDGRIVYSAADSTAVYFVTMQEIKPLTSADDLGGIYQQVIKGSLDAAKGKLIAQKDFEVNGFKGTEIVYSSDEGLQLPGPRYKRIIIVNEMLFIYDFSLTIESEVKSASNKDKFFESFALNNTTEHKESLNNQPISKNPYYIIGQYGFYLIFALVLIGVAIFITKSRKKSVNKKNN